MSQPLLSVCHIRCDRGERQVLRDLSFVVKAGELLQIVGMNGSGKTTLLRVLTGVLQPSEGKVLWRGLSIYENSVEFYRELCYLGHDLGVKPMLTVYENIQLYWHITMPSHHEIKRVIQQLGLAQHTHRFCYQLSRGQRQRVALARLLLNKTSLWILDEPFSALDEIAKSEMESVFLQKINEGGSIILTTHQPLTLSHWVTRSLQLMPGVEMPRELW